MSNKTTITVNQFRFLDAAQQANAIALRNGFGVIIGYSVYEVVAQIARRREREFQENLDNTLNRVNKVKAEMDKEVNVMVDEINEEVKEILKTYQQKLQGETSIDKINQVIHDSQKDISQKMTQHYQKLLNQYDCKMKGAIHDIHNEMHDILTHAQNDIKALINQKAMQDTKANKYALEFIRQAKEAILQLKDAYDEKCNHHEIIENLENELRTCEMNVENGLYETAMANAIGIRTSCYEDILNFDRQQVEYNNLKEEALYHLQYLQQYTSTRMRLNKDTLDTVNEKYDGILSQAMLKKDLCLFSPGKSIDVIMNKIDNTKDKVLQLSLDDLRHEIPQIKKLYEEVEKAFQDAIAYYANFIERQNFLNCIIDCFEEKGRIFIESYIGENNDQNDYTQPLFALFEDETTGSTFMVEIGVMKTSERLESQFHVHRMSGNPDNQIENNITEELVKQAISEEDDEALPQGGCEENYRHVLSDDPRILKVYRRMRG